MGRENKISSVITKEPSAVRPTDQRVYNAILKAIYEQRVLPGTKLGEEALADYFSVGRGLIRRVLMALAHQKVVDLIPHRGAFVTRPSKDDAHDIFSARRVLEKLVIERLSEAPTMAVTKTLRAHIAAEKAAIESDQSREAVRLASEFHLKLAQLSGSRVLLNILEPVLSQSSLIQNIYGGSLSEPKSVERHEGIVAAIDKGDTQRACALMYQYLTDLEKSLKLETPDPDEPDFDQMFGN